MWGAIVMGLGLWAVAGYLYQDGDAGQHGRRLGSATLDCTEDTVMVIPYILIIIFCFFGLAVICDEYFEPSLGAISEKLGLTEDVAGATFMAAGSSAPELFTSVSDAFLSKNSIGIGTIVGSAMFNILIIVAMSAAVTNGAVKVDWRPILRDVSYYTLSIAMLSYFMLNQGDVCIGPVGNWSEINCTDVALTYPVVATNSSFFAECDKRECGWGIVTWDEGLVMVLGYLSYIIFMIFNQTIMDKCAPKNNYKIHTVDTNIALENAITAVRQSMGPMSMNAEIAKALADTSDEDEEDEEGPFDIPDDAIGKAMFFFSLPLKAVFFITVPNCEKKRFENWYLLTFFMCIIWIAVLCGFMVHYASITGCILGISPPVMGVVVLAAGTSVPDAIASMIVARQGQANMAIANAVGSNVFDILLGLGIPWFLVGVLEDLPTLVDTDGIVIGIAILMGTVVFYLGVIAMNNWTIGSHTSKAFVALYLCYITYTLLGEFCIIKVTSKCD